MIRHLRAAFAALALGLTLGGLASIALVYWNQIPAPQEERP